MTDIPITGAPELLQFLRAFPERLQKGALKSAATAAAKPIRDEARLLARKQSGLMAKAIKTGRPQIDQAGNVSVRIRLRGPHAFLGVFNEYGVAAHFISAGDSTVSTRLLNRAAKRDGVEAAGEAMKIGNNFVTGAVQHPGTPAHPFMRPALDNKAREATAEFGKRIVSYLQQRTGFTGPELAIEGVEE